MVEDTDGLLKRIKEQEDEIRELKGEVRRLREGHARISGSVEAMLERRGFRVYRKEQDGDVIKPAPGLEDEFYSRLKRYSFRLFLRDAIKYQDGFAPEELGRFFTIEAAREYAAFLERFGIAVNRDGRYVLKDRPVRSFGPTLEWFVAEILRREYAAEALWGIRFRNTQSGGDYDIIANVEGRLFYAEVKSSPPKQIYDTEIKAFINRHMELSPDFSFFIMDTELRMKDKIVFLFERALPSTPLGGQAVERLRAELFHIGGRIFIINSKGGLDANIGECLAWFLKRRVDEPH